MFLWSSPAIFLLGPLDPQLDSLGRGESRRVASVIGGVASGESLESLMAIVGLLPEFMNLKLFGTILVGNIKFGLFFGPSTQQVGLLWVGQEKRRGRPSPFRKKKLEGPAPICPGLGEQRALCFTRVCALSDEMFSKFLYAERCCFL